MGRTIVMLVMLLGASAAGRRSSSGRMSAPRRPPPTGSTAPSPSTGRRAQARRITAMPSMRSGAVSPTPSARRRPIVVPDRFSFRPLATAIPSYLHAELQSVSWNRTETIDGCGDGSASATRTSTVENILDRRAIFEQATTLNRLGGASEPNVGAITLYIWQNGAPQRDFSAYSNLGKVFVRSTGGCAEVLNGKPGTAQVPMHDLFSLGMFQLGGRGLRVKGRKTADGAFAFHGTTRSADVSPCPTSHNTIKVTVDLRVTGSSGARGFHASIRRPPSSPRLAPSARRRRSSIVQASSPPTAATPETGTCPRGTTSSARAAPPGIADFRRAGLACTGRPAERAPALPVVDDSQPARASFPQAL